MNDGPSLSLFNWLLAAIPIVLLVAAILWRGWSAPRAGAIAWLIALSLALLSFGGSATTLALASAKGLSLSLFVLSIVWTSIYLFNIALRLRGIEAIGRSMSRLANDRLVQALLIGWGFSGFIQGITGFGVPVAVATPLLVMMGFPVIRAAAIVLVGHGWAVTFGSLGSSYYTLALVTGLPEDVLAPHVALLFGLPLTVTGLAVAHIQSGMRGLIRSMPLVLAVGGLMTLTMWSLAVAGAPQIASAAAGLVAVAGIAGLSRTPLIRNEPAAEASITPPPPSSDESATDRPMGFHMGFLPYYFLIGLSILSLASPIQSLSRHLTWGLDYPGFSTADGFRVQAVQDYASIGLLDHPAPLIVASVIMAAAVYALRHRWRKGVGWEALQATYQQSIATTVGVATMVMMAVIMADMGMTTLLAQGIAQASGSVFPVLSPYVGVLGAFMTGSNTNSNAMFGLLQVEAAKALDIGQVTIAGAQTVGGSIGSSVAPAKVLVAAALTGLAGRESEILRLAILYVLGLVLLVGLETIIITKFVTNWAR